MTSPTQLALAPSPTRDAARERVVQLLTDRYADDTLTVEAFEAQLDRMHALATVEALDAMARELTAAAGRHSGQPAPQAVARAAPVAPTAPTAPTAPAPPGRRAPALAPMRDRITAFMSNTRRSGAWEVPTHLRVSSVMSEVVLDLRDAVLPPVCEIEVFACLGNFKLRLPPGARAHVEVESLMANVDDRAERGQPGGPLVRVSGRVVLGEVKLLRG